MDEEYNIAYIDNTNLYKGCEAEDFILDYKKFRVFLSEKYNVQIAYIFIGYLFENEDRYNTLHTFGYTLIFKPVVMDNIGSIKGNCDAELVLQSVRDVFEKSFGKSILVTSDGDFACLANFLITKDKLEIILSPRRGNKCSVLIKRLPSKITFMPEIKNKIKV